MKTAAPGWLIEIRHLVAEYTDFLDYMTHLTKTKFLENPLSNGILTPAV